MDRKINYYDHQLVIRIMESMKLLFFHHQTSRAKNQFKQSNNSDNVSLNLDEGNNKKQSKREWHRQEGDINRS